MGRRAATRHQRGGASPVSYWSMLSAENAARRDVPSRLSPSRFVGPGSVCNQRESGR